MCVCVCECVCVCVCVCVSNSCVCIYSGCKQRVNILYLPYTNVYIYTCNCILAERVHVYA